MNYVNTAPGITIRSNRIIIKHETMFTIPSEKFEEEILKKELSFDLYGRYAVMRDIINRNRDKDQSFKVLDVGGRGNLMKKFLPKDKVFYLDPYVNTDDSNYIEGDGCAMPLENSSFDWVVSADVFEHIPESKRDDFINENIRVAKMGAILAAPFYSREVKRAEIIANENYKIVSGGKDYIWLKEHIENGLPDEKKLEELIASKNLDFQKIHNNRLFLWEILINSVLTVHEDASQKVSKDLENFNQKYNNEIFPFDNQEPSYRKIYFIKKQNKLKDLTLENKAIDSSIFLNILGEGTALMNKLNKEKKDLLQIKEEEIQTTNQKISQILREEEAKIIEYKSGLEKTQKKAKNFESKYKKAIDRNAQMNELIKMINKKNNDLEEQVAKISVLEHLLKQKEHELALIQASKFWKARNRYMKIKNFDKNEVKFILKESRRVLRQKGIKRFLWCIPKYALHGKDYFKKKEDPTDNKNSTYCLIDNNEPEKNIAQEIRNFVGNDGKNTILLISHEASTTGAPLLTLNIGKRLVKDFGKKVITIVLKGGPIEKDFSKIGLLINLNEITNGQLIKKEEISRIFRIIRECEVSKCFCNSVVSGILVPFLETSNFDYASLIHEQPGSIKKNDYMGGLTPILEYASKIVFSSNFVKDEFRKFFGEKISRAIVRPQGIFSQNPLKNQKKLARYLLRKKLEIPQNSKVVFGCGYADERKGFDVFHKIAALAKEKRIKDLHFVWLGDRDKKLAKKMKVYRKEKKISNIFHLFNFKKDPSIFFAGSDIFLLTSREDPFPSVVLDAMNCGLPVIAFDGAGGSPELLRQGAGIVAPYLDLEYVAEQLSELLIDKEKYNAISQKAASLIETDFKFLDYVKFLLGSLKIDSKPKIVKKSNQLKVSVIVPNYNYERFLDDRLYSIISQTYRPSEIIFLDDNSKDKSVILAKNFLSKIDIPYKIIRNEINVGCFGQWNKGIKEAQGDLVWIAEADDFCEREFLERLVEKFDDPTVGLAFSQSLRMDEKGKVGDSYLEYLESLPGHNNRWKKDYLISGKEEIEKYLVIKNTIVNASAVLMRKSLFKEIKNLGDGLSQAGDWITYVRILKQSKLAYIAEPLNYHRYHSGNIVSRSGATSLEKGKQLVNETFYVQNFILSDQQISRRRSRLALNHLQTICKNNCGKELSEFSEFKNYPNIYKDSVSKSPKKILFFSTNNNWGGSEVACTKLAESFEKDGWQVSLVMKKYMPKPKILKYLASKKDVLFFEREEEDYLNDNKTTNFISDLDPDLIFISQGHVFESLELMKWCVINQYQYVNFIPLITKYHLENLGSGCENFIEENRRYLQKSEKIFLDNLSAHRVLEEIFKTKFNNTEKIFNDFDVEYNQKFFWKKQEGDAFHLAFIGRLEKVHKGLDMLISILSKKKWSSRQLILDIYGDGPYEEFIRETIKKHRLKNLVLHGYTNKVGDAILNSHGVIFPSRMEGTPISLVDSLLTHRMAIVTPVGGMPEIVKDGETGFVARSVTENSIESCMEEAWKRRAEWKEMGLRAGRTIRRIIPKNPHVNCIETTEKIINE